MKTLLFIGSLGGGEIMLIALILLVPLFLILLICGAFTSFPPDPQTLDTSEWKPRVNKIWSGFILYLLAGAIGTILDWADKISDLGSMLSSRSSEDFMEAWLNSNVDILSGTTVANIVAIIGFIIYYTGLKSFAEIQKDDFTAENILKIRSAAIYGIIALVLGYIPFIGGIAGWIFNLVMYFSLASAFGYLRYSPVFNIRAKAGARLLRTAAIMYIISMFIPFIGGFFSFMGLLMTIIGWGRIYKGGPIAAVTPAAANVTYNNYYVGPTPTTTPPAPNPTTPVSDEKPKFCSHCGAPCKEYQKYCPNCGFELQTYKKPEEPAMPIIEEKTISVAPPKPPKMEAEPQEVLPKKEEKEPKKSNIRWITMITGLLFLFFIGTFAYIFWYKPYAVERDAPRYYTFTNLNLRSTQDAESKSNIITMLPYGSEVITFEKGYTWARVKANGMEGYVSSNHLITRDEFQLLDNAWGNEDAKKCMGAGRYRLALIDYLKQKGYTSGANGWQIYAEPYGSKANTVWYPRICTPKSEFEDLFFIITNNETKERNIVIYHFENETERPIFQRDESVQKEGLISKITGDRTGIFSNTLIVQIYFGANSVQYITVELR